jgi:hypothetical protein
MKVFVVIVFPALLPCFAMAQHSGANPSFDCPLSHWSTTGAACLYAPDLTPAAEATLKSGRPIWNTRAVLPTPGWKTYSPPPAPPFVSDSLKDLWMRILPDSVFEKMVPTLPDDLLKQFMRVRSPSEMKELVPDSTMKRLQK